MDPKIVEYRTALQVCIVAAKLLHQHDLPGLLRAIEHADAFGPLLDPTLWREKNQDLGEDRKILEAALPLWRLAQKMAAAATRHACACGHPHVAGADGEDGGCRDAGCPCTTWRAASSPEAPRG